MCQMRCICVSTFTAPNDYTGGTRLLTFTPSTIQQSVSIPITDDSVFEPTERFRVGLIGPSEAAVIISPDEATVEITDDDCKLLALVSSIM